jgi:hypothetical protein
LTDPGEDLMTRREVLKILVQQARANGFEFRRWFKGHIEPTWTSVDAAVETLCSGQRYYSLLFSHDFASHFWQQGAQISFLVPSIRYTRRDKSGKEVTITRKAFTRRTLKPDAWRYHLREMAAADDPLLYIRRFLVTLEEVQEHVP